MILITTALNGRKKKILIMRNIITTLMLLVMTACNSQSTKLFQVDKDNKNDCGFLYFVESRNVRPISADSIRFFLNWDEKASTKLLESKVYPSGTNLPTPTVFKNYGKLYSSKKFNAYILLKICNDSLGRDYKFIIRTYTPDWEIIDSYVLAVWNEHKKEFYFGSINKNLIIERKREKSKVTDIMQIMKNGKIIMTSYTKS